MIDGKLADEYMSMIRVHQRSERPNYHGRRDPWLIVQRFATMEEAEALENSTTGSYSIGVPQRTTDAIPSPRPYTWSVVVPMWRVSEYPDATEVAWIEPRFFT